MRNKKQIIDEITRLNGKYISLLGGTVIDFDIEKSACTFEFNISKDYCHSIDVVQGGFVTAMLDAAMSAAVAFSYQGIRKMSSLEIKTNYLEPTHAGKLRVEGWAVKKGYTIAFMEGRLYNQDNVLTATASSIGKVSRAPK